MEEGSITKKLRSKQLIYTNLVFILYGLMIYTLILTGVSSRTIYFALAAVFLISPISLLMRSSPNPLLFFLPDMKRLLIYEKEKLGDFWFSYYTSTLILHTSISLFFLIQAVLRDFQTPFVEGIPLWYLIVVPIVLLFVGNWNQHFHAKRIDEKSYDELKEYAYEKRLFSIVFAVVSIIVTLLAIGVVQVMTSITPP